MAVLCYKLHISQKLFYLATSHYSQWYYPVPVGTHDSDWTFTLLDPLGGVNGQIFNFAITQSVVNVVLVFLMQKGVQ